VSSVSCWRDFNLYSCGKGELNQSLPNEATVTFTFHASLTKIGTEMFQDAESLPLLPTVSETMQGSKLNPKTTYTLDARFVLYDDGWRYKR
jgi:hypothetical protein